jgi:F-type H+-transporting ATPase subunit delta
MQSEKLARRYATAVFNLAREAGTIDNVGRDLAAAADPIYGSDDVRRFYLSPVFGRKKKEDVLRKVFEGKLGDTALFTLLLLVRKRREALLPQIVTEYQKLALAASGREPVEIVSARPLSSKEVDDIVARLARTYARSFAATYRTDPALLGGVRITMGDRRIDGSLAGRFDELSRELNARN